MVVLMLLACSRCAIGSLRCGNCGKILVPYPLSTGPGCGDQAYKIRCTAGTLWFDTVGSDIKTEGIQLDDNLPFNITGSNTILLLNCTDAMLHLQVPINCSSTSICHSYIKDNVAAAECMKSQLCCMFKTGGSQTAYVVRVHSGGCLAYQSFVNIDSVRPPNKWPDPVMELEWALPQEPVSKTASDCKDLLNSKCLVDPMNQGQRTKCKHGKHCASKKKRALTHGIVGVLGGISVVALVGILAYRHIQRRKKQVHKHMITKTQEMLLNAKNSGGKSARIFTEEEITRATNNFSREYLIGSGGFGEVFKGTLENGTVTAIKRAKMGSTKGLDQVVNEVRILCQVNHRNLVRLLGCCIDLEQPVLVYEFIPNGTLFEHLHCPGKWAPLSWNHRLRIAHQTAEGFAYLHFAAVPPIYHRDVKSSNILLDEKLNVKVSDFGLSRLVERSADDTHTQSHICTSAQGTLGYLDPEYYRSLQLTDKSDVYSFGVVLLELLTSMKAVDFNRDDEDVNLSATNLELEMMKALGLLAGSCLDEKRLNRPSMKKVADEIEYIIDIAAGSMAEQVSEAY
ncbi:hypothetical protein SLEP1_g21466 [Rubroshorea leprosula]|uniref:Protein kinase domain-containing protein n=1 Tax=Rubroshorea leprosula TaxID=152421 RepID=A0AAV5J606_9ROSI|nr:hypothetical protein SLEP1_g21466 [Rubroshorea leprosula]